GGGGGAPARAGRSGRLRRRRRPWPLAAAFGHDAGLLAATTDRWRPSFDDEIFVAARAAGAQRLGSRQANPLRRLQIAARIVALIGDLVELVGDLLATAASLLAVGAGFAGRGFADRPHGGQAHVLAAIVHALDQSIGNA